MNGDRKRTPQPRRRRSGTGVRPTPRRLRNTLHEQVSSALKELTKPDPSDPEVHAARKFIKKSRATLRLMRDSLGDDIYRRENRALRDAARPLSAARDSKVLLEALETLSSKHRVDAATCEAVRAALTQEQERLHRQSAARKKLNRSRSMLRAVLRRSSRWPLGTGDDSQLVRSAKRVYRRGRRAFETACEDRNAENLHEWRKHVKYLWHQMQTLESPDCPAIAKRGRELHKLSDDLGDDHDLAVLSDWVRRKRGLLSRAASRKFFATIQRRQAHLQKSAFTRGRRAFSERPGRFAEKLERLSERNLRRL